jgi:hypothetical protein
MVGFAASVLRRVRAGGTRHNRKETACKARKGLGLYLAVEITLIQFPLLTPEHRSVAYGISQMQVTLVEGDAGL